MSTLIVKGGFYIWPELLQFLSDNLDNNELSIVENSLAAIAIIVEDSSSLFDDEKFYQLICSMVLKIFALLNPNSSEKIKSNGINTINMLLVSGT